MEISENSEYNSTNDRDQKDNVSESNNVVKSDDLKHNDLSECDYLNTSINESLSRTENIFHSLLENKSKKRELSTEMEFRTGETSHKVIKLSDNDDSSNNSNDDISSSIQKIDDVLLEEKYDTNKNNEKSSLSTEGCAQAMTSNVTTVGSGDTISENSSMPSEATYSEAKHESFPSSSVNEESQDKSSSSLSNSFLEEANSCNLICDELEETPHLELSEDSSSQDTSSCDSTSSSSDFISMFSELEDEDEDDNFGLVSNEGIHSEDEQNSETEDNKLPPVLQKTLPADKFSFPKEIMMRQVNSGDGKRRHYSNFESKVYGSRRMVQRLELFKSLKKHNGCVNTLSFNDTGDILISASDDKHVSLWNWAENKNLLHFNSGHIANVFQAKFLPYSSDRTLISCGQDYQVRKCLLDGCGLKSTSLIAKHEKAVHKIAMQPQMPNSFLTAGEDGVVYSIDIREDITYCNKLLKVHGHRLNSMATICLYSIHCNPVKNYEFIVGGSCEKIRLYDQRNISSKRQNPVKEFRVGCDLADEGGGMLTTVTCAVYNHNGTEILASYNDNDVFLFSSNETSRYTFRYDGHRNITTIKGVNFFGPQSEFVVSGSDCGYIYIWDKKSESVVQWMKGDKDIVNCLEPHPSFPVLATSGLDSDVKVWMPLSNGCEDITSKKEFQKVVKKNLYYKQNNSLSRDESAVNFFYFLVSARRA